ncbi:MAG: type II secretion system GspH family protein [Synergistaceae bacterium]|jgi:prepilin-type N-terminal cleavage/methylation domain-containing protein|nr:type II secretion system GspH family protein [Synergistaceae bacterium]
MGEKEFLVSKKASRGKRAFSLVELLIVIIVVAILGGAAVSALWMIFNMLNQTSDYIGGREEIEFVAQSVGREISNVGLGMPNNRKARGSFAASFAGSTPPPIMAIMGNPGEAWGGPVTLGHRNLSDNYARDMMVQSLETVATGVGSRDVYHGPELYYAWGVPTGVKARYEAAAEGGIVEERNSSLELEILESTGLDALRDFKYSLRDIGIVANDAKNPSSWILFPTSRIPMLIESINTGDSKLNVSVAPDPGDLTSISMSGPFTGLDEVCLPQAARLYLNGHGEVVQLVFGADYEDSLTTATNILAHNIAGLHFMYDPELRILTMFIAAQGEERFAGAPAASGWPSFAAPLSDDRRLVINRIDWRIRN